MIEINGENYYTPKEAAEKSGISKTSIKTHRYDEGIFCIKHKNSYLYAEKCLDNFKKYEQKEKLTITNINERLLTKNIELIGEFSSPHKKSIFRCMVCDFEWESYVSHILYGESKCPICSQKYNIEDINTLLSKKSFSLDPNEIFFGITKKNKIICAKCNYVWDIEPKRILEGRRCPNCSTRNANVKKLFEDKIKTLKIKLLSEYKDTQTNVELNCSICGKIWSSTPNNMLRPFQGCSHCIRSIPLEEAKKRISNKKITILDGYTSFSNKAKLQCDICSNIWHAAPDQVFRISGCPICNTNKNEKLTFVYLKEIFPNYEITPQHKIKEKVRISNYLLQNSVRVDFMFYIDKQKFIVEYNGVQHYRETKWRWTTGNQPKKNLLRQKLRDKWLRSYCKNNNILLIEIDGRKYTDDKIKDYLIKAFSLLQVPLYVQEN